MHDILYHPLFGVALTSLAYVISLAIHHRWNFLHPLLFTSVMLICFLLIFHVPYEAYKVGGDLILFFLGPATVALGVPLYKNAQKIRKHILPVITGITIGSISGIISAGFFVWFLGGSQKLVLSMMAKSVTTPIAIEISREIGGIPSITAVFTVLTGLLGSMIGPEFLRLFGVRSDLPLATAIGTASHGIGTARLIRESEFQGTISALSMALAGIITSLLAIPIYWMFH